MSTRRTALLIGTLDTKAAELAYVRELIEARGHDVLLMDAGILKDPAVESEVPARAVAEAGGTPLAALRERGDRGSAVDVMIAGVRRLAREMYEAGRFQGVLAHGGGQVKHLVGCHNQPFEGMIVEYAPDRQFEAVVREQMTDVLDASRREVVQHVDAVPAFEKVLGKVTADEAGAAGDQVSHRV